MAFNSKQGALTVFYDLIRKDAQEPSSIRTYMEKVFPSQEYIYKQVDKAPDYNTMMKDILDRRDEMDIIIPAGNKMVFCFYLDIGDLTREWLDQFYLRAQELRRKQPVEQIQDQHHVICFRFKVAELAPEVIREKAELLSDFGKNRSISKEIFMFRTTALERFDKQEQGMVECLFLQTRVESNREYVTMRNNSPDALRMVVYEDYYENRATKCAAGIEEIDRWLKTSADPEFTLLKDSIKEVSINALSELRVITRNFNRVTSLYPVNEEDFEPVKTLFFITGYTSRIGRNHPILVEQRQKRIDDKKESLIEGVDDRKIIDVINKYHYPDLENLSSVGEEFANKLVSEILMDQRQKLPEEEDFAKQIVNYVMNKISRLDLLNNLNDAENGIKAKKERARKLLQKESLTAGIYRNLDECLENIDDHARAYVINGMISTPSYKCALVNDNCYERLQGAYGGIIVGFDITYNYSDIEPCEVVVVKVCNILDLGLADAEKQLLRVLE